MRRVGVFVLLVLLSGCHAGLVRDRQVSAQATIGPSTPGPAASLTPAAAATPEPIDQPLLVLTVTDAHGGHPADIPVNVSGPVSGVFKSNSRGELTFSKGGVYHFVVVTGCTDVVQVFSGGTATAGLTPGQTIHGAVRVDWRHRISPAPPTFSDPAGTWPRNGNAAMQYSVIDRCVNKFAPNASYPTFRFATSPNLHVVGTPVLRSNAKSRASVTVRCSAPGAVKLVAYDSANPTDSFDLVRESVDYGPPRCG